MTSNPGSSAVPAGLRIITVNAVCAMAELDNCILTVWHLQPTADSFNLRHQELVNLAKRAPGKCAYVELIEPTSTPPSDELRKVAVEAFRNLGTDLACVGFVLDGTQLRTAFVRAVLTGMTFLIPQMQPSKVFKRISDMAEWVRVKTGQSDPAFEQRILSAFDHLRATTTA